MFKTVPYKEDHIWPLVEQPMNRATREFYTSGQARALVASGGSFTLLKDDVPLVCGGIIDIWPGRGQIWCMFNEETKTNFIPVFRAISRFLKERLKTYNRIEVCIPYGFEVGVRRAEMLGFEVEIARARRFLPDGTDCVVLTLVGE